MNTQLCLRLCLLISAIPVAASPGFSPYENYLMTGKETHVGLIAEIKPQRRSDFEKAWRQCGAERLQQSLERAGISRLRAFTRQIEGKEYVVMYFAYAGGRPYLGAAAGFEQATVPIDWSATTTAHPRAKTYDRHWLQMEWINFIAGHQETQAEPQRLMIATSVIPAMEMQYRTLHQTVWPGVVDQAVRGKIRNLNIFLVELDDHVGRISLPGICRYRSGSRRCGQQTRPDQSTLVEIDRRLPTAIYRCQGRHVDLDGCGGVNLPTP